MKRSLIRLPFFLLLALGSLAVACGDDGGGVTDGDYDDDGIPDDEDPDDDNDGIPDEEDDCPFDETPDCSGGGDDDGGGGDGGGGEETSCRHIDIVVAVDSSGSMQEEMEAMADEVFGGPNGFANALLSISEGLDDYRVGTIDACPTPAVMHTRGAGGECNFASGERWIVGTPDRNPDEVISEFECVGDIWAPGDQQCTDNPEEGTKDDDEQPALSVLRALEPPYLNGENAGFLRDDAVLVVVAITDEDEELLGTGGNPTTVQGLYTELVAAKGSVNNMVFLGIGGGVPDGCNNGAYGRADPAHQLKALTDLFIAQDRGVWWDLCDGNLGDGLSQAIEVIEQACDEFEPPID